MSCTTTPLYHKSIRPVLQVHCFTVKRSFKLRAAPHDADSFDWVRRRLARYGFEVQWAVTVGGGLLKLDAGPCAVILDLAMPDGSGTRILRAIRDRNPSMQSN